MEKFMPILKAVAFGAAGALVLVKLGYIQGTSHTPAILVPKANPGSPTYSG